MPSNAELAKEVDALRKEVADMRESMKMFNELYENMKKQTETLTKDNKTLHEANRQLTMRIGEQEQYSRLNNVEIRGVPCTEGESCLQIVQDIGSKVGCPIIASDIDIVHRVPAKNKTTHIIARFCSRSKKAEFASKARKARMTTGKIGFTENSDEPVFVNDHLTPENKRLFAQALALKKEKGWKYLWTDRCAIKARKTDDSRVHRISSTNDLAIIS